MLSDIATAPVSNPDVLAQAASIVEQIPRLACDVLVGPFGGIDVLASMVGLAPVREGHVAVAVSSEGTVGVYDLAQLIARATTTMLEMEDKLNA